MSGETGPFAAASLTLYRALNGCAWMLMDTISSTSSRSRQHDFKYVIYHCSLTRSLYAGDFNSTHTDWGYKNNSADGDRLHRQTPTNNPKNTTSFQSCRCNTGTNPDLAFYSIGPDSCSPHRRVLEKFQRSTLAHHST